MYTTKEAAKRLGLSERHLRLLLEKGEIRGKKLGRDWVVLKLDYKRKRSPKTKRAQAEAQEGGEEWTEGSL